MSLHKVRPGADEESLRAELETEPFYNLLLLADLAEGLGPEVEAWWDPGKCCVVRYHRNWLVARCDQGPTDWREAAMLIDRHPGPVVRNLLGRHSAVREVAAELRNHRGRSFAQTFAVLEGPPAATFVLGCPRPAEDADLPALVSMYSDAGDMSATEGDLVARMRRLWVLVHQGEVRSAAVFSAQTDYAAMIGGVFTPEVHRRRGYASSLLYGMCSHLDGQGRQACLFYHNPHARRLYLRLGFREVGPWALVRFE